LFVSIYTRFIIDVNYCEHGRFDVLTAVLTIIHICCDMTPCSPARSKWMLSNSCLNPSSEQYKSEPDSDGLKKGQVQW
jgi:hypothetical protein